MRLDSIHPTDPEQRRAASATASASPSSARHLGHDGQMPGYSTFMVYNLKTGDTIIVACNLSASPVKGANAATVRRPCR